MFHHKLQDERPHLKSALKHKNYILCKISMGGKKLLQSLNYEDEK